MSKATSASVILLLTAASGCKVYDPLYCDESRPCTNPDRPFCDVNGEYPASEGIGRTCIPSPSDDDGSGDDGGSSNDGGSDDDGGFRADGSVKRTVVDVAVGKDRSCAILNDGGLRCWGAPPLGYPKLVGTVGDDELPFEVGDVPTGGPVKQVALGSDFTCILYVEGGVRCVGEGQYGQLGYGNTFDLFESPADIDDVSLGERAVQIVAGISHACALLESGSVRCWGNVFTGGLGYGNGEFSVGDDEVPSDLPAIVVGGPVSALTAGSNHVCAILDGSDGRVRCWGAQRLPIISHIGLLGHPGVQENIGHDEHPAVFGDVDVGGPAASVIASNASNCVLLAGGRVKCWGMDFSILGYGTTVTYGDNEDPAEAPDISLGGDAVQLGAGPKCAVLSDGKVKCWGYNLSGELGLGHTDDIGDDELPSAAGATELGGYVVKLARGTTFAHQCALLEGGAVRCWGLNESGQLGLGHLENVGDDELPVDEQPVRVLE